MTTPSQKATQGERVATIGSRDYPDLARVRTYVRALAPGTTVVSGGARGVDLAATQEAQACGLATQEWFPNWERDGHGAALRRNHLVVDNCDRVVAFWDGVGTAYTIRLARDRGKPLTIYR